MPDRSTLNKSPLTPPTVVFPALYLGSKELAAALAGMPDYVLPVLTPDLRDRIAYRGVCLVDDFSDIASLLQRLGDWSQSTGRAITGILGIDDEDQFAISRSVARHFGLDFYADATLAAASNKLLMKSRFVCHGVPTGAFARVSDDDPPAAILEVGFPNVLKPLTGSGSEYVFLNRDPGELAENIRYLRTMLDGVRDDPRFGTIDAPIGRRGESQSFDTRREFLLEEYLEGEEFSCDFAVQCGRVQLLRVVKKLPGGHLGLFGGFYLMNERTWAAEGIDSGELASVCGRVARALGVERGVQMLDFKLGPDGLRVIETSIRPGFSAFVMLMQALYGVTSLGLAARLVGGEEVSFKVPEVEGLAVYLIVDGPGTVRRVDTSGLDALRPRIDVIDTWLYAQPGQAVADAKHDHFDLIQGYVLVKDPGREAVGRVAEAVRRACVVEVHADEQIRTEKGRSLV
jgi:S-sulfo-L-cysteine synthase (3-phospho-L-serine-dependent)